MVDKIINDHLGEELTLDKLSAEFYIDKCHLCRVFKNITGYTMNRYINYKRLLLAKELHNQGQSLLETGANAGFNGYSHFLKM